MNYPKLFLLPIVVLLSSSCSSFFSGSDPLPLSTADRDIVKNSVVQMGSIPRVIDASKKETTKVYVFAFDGTENDRGNFDKVHERQTAVGYLSLKLENVGVPVVYTVGPGVGNKIDSGYCFSCEGKALEALEVLKGKIDRETSTNSEVSIKVVVLGFSRGAAIGRHFMNLISEKWPYQSQSHVRTYGLLFDTVATSIKDELTLGIAPTTDYLVHIIARDERRRMFPVIIDNDQAFESDYAGNSVTTPRLTQLTLPGAHSDIGTSYKFGIGTFYMYLGEVVLADYGLLQQPVMDFNEDFLSQGAHDSRGLYSKGLGTKSHLDDPESIRETISKNSISISQERADRIKARNEANIPEYAGSFFSHTESHPLVFEVHKSKDDLKIVSASTTFLRRIEKPELEKSNGERCIAFNFDGEVQRKKLVLEDEVWNALPEGERSKLELVPLNRNGQQSLFIFIDDKRIKEYLYNGQCSTSANV
ncbi:conserved exported hypothetical protein [Vibrio chagasii]|nr:conserved exported hypothetical protein [Vibrio chagasii]